MAVFPTERPPAGGLRRAARLGLLPLGLIGGYIGGRALRPTRHLPLPPALSGAVETLDLPFGKLSYYRGGMDDGAPLLLIHSVNAAASAYEVKPLYEHYARTRSVFAVDLPGFGFSDRPDRIYTPRLMTDALTALVEAIRRRHGHFPIDAIAVSTSCEFLARAASEHCTLFRSLGFVSPTGFQESRPGEGPAGATYGRESLRDIVSFPLWSRGLFDALVSRPSLRFFLAKTWGSTGVDRGLLDYDYLTAHQPGAEHAPFSFISGFLFSADIMTVYRSLVMPVFLCHGRRGDYVDYKRLAEFGDRPQWTIRVFDTGALCYFERPDDVFAAYDDFHDSVA